MFRQVTEYRACKVLYNFIMSNHMSGMVALPANICPDVLKVVELAGLLPVFVDINSITLCIDRQELLEVINDVRMVLYVHTYGIESDESDFFRELHELNSKVVIVDDRCLCLYEPITDSEADLILYSTGDKKVVEMGMGGIGLIGDCWNYEQLEGSVGFLKDFSWVLNTDEYAKKKFETLEHKKRLNKIYSENLPVGIQLSAGFQQWRFNILVEDKEQTLREIFNNNLFASGHYKPLVGGCVNSEYLYNHVINLFNDMYYSEEKALKTCAIIDMLSN